MANGISMSTPTLSHVRGYGQLLVLDESLTVLLVLVDIIEIAWCVIVIVLSEINDDEMMMI